MKERERERSRERVRDRSPMIPKISLDKQAKERVIAGEFVTKQQNKDESILTGKCNLNPPKESVDEVMGNTDNEGLGKEPRLTGEFSGTVLLKTREEPWMIDDIQQIQAPVVKTLSYREVLKPKTTYEKGCSSGEAQEEQ